MHYDGVLNDKNNLFLKNAKNSDTAMARHKWNEKSN